MKIMRFVVLTGTMPDIIKQAPVVWEGDRRKKNVVLIHSGQHQAKALVYDQYQSIGLRAPDFSLDSPNELSTFINPGDIVLVHGDTNTARIGAEVAHFNSIAVGHVEAGLRTISREPFPEQTNTRIVDACSTVFFAPTALNADNLRKEGFDHNNIHIVGNTVVDIAKKFIINTEKTNKIWFCVHRNENMRDPQRMRGILEFLEWLSIDNEVHFIDRQRTEWITVPDKVIRHGPIPYVESLNFMSSCRLVITDSGSIQEETCALGIPTITVRNDTDRPESVGYNNILGGTKFDSLKSAYFNHSRVMGKHNIYGDGDSASKIWDILEIMENGG